MIYDLIILGGGPAGTAAGVYAGRKQLKTLLITEGFGGQSVVSDDIQNWIGDVSVSGVELAKKFEQHLKAQEKLEILVGKAGKVEKSGEGFVVETGKGERFEGKAILITTGARRKKLGIPGEDKFEGKGVAYCATCDAPLFAGKEVAVIGGGNAGLESVIDLEAYATKIYLLEYSNFLRGDAITIEKVEKSPKVEIILEAKAKEVVGEMMVSGLKYEDLKSGQEKELAVGGVFVEIGSVPNSEMVRDLVKINEGGEIVVDHKMQMSSVEGIWAAGDVSDVLYKQNNISAGDAIKAVLNIQEWLNRK